MRRPLLINSRKVAEAAGVSQSTVSKVANNSSHLTAETRERVIQAARRLGYPLLPRNGQRMVALIVPTTSLRGYVANMLSSVSQELLMHGFRLEIIPDTMLEIINERCVDAAIAISWRDGLNEEWAQKLILPLVRVNGAPDHLNNIYSVLIDGMFSLRQQVDRLWKLGHRKIGFFFFNNLEHELKNQARRRDGFLAAMRAHGVENPEEFCAYDCLEQKTEALIRTLKKWRREGVSAIFFSNSLGTGKMLHVIQKCGLKIPKDLSVIGWEQEGLAEHLEPPLSTFHVDTVQIAASAVSLLETLLSHPAKAHDIMQPYHWIERKSIGKNRIN